MWTIPEGITFAENHAMLCCQGCLKPVQVIIPEGCLLNPSENAAVVGGNILTSQRVTDVIFKAFSTCAASQVRGIWFSSFKACH